MCVWRMTTSRAPLLAGRRGQQREDRGGPQTQDMLVPGEPGRSVRGVMSGPRTRRAGCWGGMLTWKMGAERDECRGPCRVQAGLFLSRRGKLA